MEQLLVNGVCRGASYALLAAGFCTVFLTTRVFHLAYACTCVLAAYSVHYVVVILGGHVFLGFLVAAATASALGLLIEIALYYPLERVGSSSTSLLLASLGIAITVENVFSLMWGARPRVLLQPGLPPYHFADVSLASSQYLPLVTAAIAAPALHLLLKYSNSGLLWRAISDRPETAAILGVDVKRIRAAAIAFGSALGGLGFVLHLSDAAVTPNAAFQVTIVAALSAGIARGHPTVAMLVAFVLGVSQSILLLWLPTRWEPVTTAFVLLIAVLWRPDGFRKSRRDDE